MRRPRAATRVQASRRPRTPATWAAANSPTECPASRSGRTPNDSSSRYRATSTANSAGWVYAVCSSSSAESRTSASGRSSSGSRWARTSSKAAAKAGEHRREAGAHARQLGALAGEEEGEPAVGGGAEDTGLRCAALGHGPDSGGEFAGGAAEDGGPVDVPGAGVGERAGQAVRVGVRGGGQVFQQPGGLGAQGVRGVAGEQPGHGVGGRGGGLLGGFPGGRGLDDHVCVGAGDTEGGDTGAARAAGGRASGGPR